jgi:hypothetical protein
MDFFEKRVLPNEMIKFSIDDKVIVCKGTSIKNVSAIITFIGYDFITVRYNFTNSLSVDGSSGCNIFYDDNSESIELDLEEIRNDKLKTLGI